MMEAFDLIKSSKRILLHLHPKPDPDSIGSALATYHALKGMGKEVTVIEGDSKLPETFSCLPGYGDIARQNYFDTDLSQFDLFIIQDSGSKGMIGRMKEAEFPAHLKTLAVDHHKTNDHFADINLVDTSYAATAEYLYDLFKEWGIEITPDIAANLYVGIYGDTGGFKYSNTTPRTFKAGSELAAIYPAVPKLISEMENSNSKGKIYFDALALSSVETCCDDSVAISAVSFEDQQKKGIAREDSDNSLIANMLISVRQWKIGVTLIEKAPSEVSISFRSKEKDISGIAESLGGGGHALAAGARLMMPLEEAKKKVIDALKSAC